MLLSGLRALRIYAILCSCVFEDAPILNQTKPAWRVFAPSIPVVSHTFSSRHVCIIAHKKTSIHPATRSNVYMHKLPLYDSMVWPLAQTSVLHY